MAERRMFTKKITESDSFLDMPSSTQALYFHLSMNADDDGFVNSPKSIMRTVGASVDDLNILLAKKFILSFESGVIVIKHWKMHNYIQSDRYKPTDYIEEKSLLMIDEKKAYTYNLEDVSKVDTKCIQDVSIGEDRLGKGRLGKDRVNKELDEHKAYFPDDEELEKTFNDFISMRKKIKAPMTDRAIELAIKSLVKLADDGGMFDHDIAIEILNQSIMNSWKGLFPLKDNKSCSTKGKRAEPDWANL